MSENKIRVGITHGDTNGIGYEVIIKALIDPRINEMCTIIVYGSGKAAAIHKKNIAESENFSFNIISSTAEANPRRSNLVNVCDENLKIDFGTATPESGAAALASLKSACADLKAGKIDVLVTAPINKSNIQSDEFHFPGHTEFLAAEFGDSDTMMIMANENTRTGLVTIHIPLEQVSREITKEAILKKLELLKKTLVRDYRVQQPKIAVLALNPHAGDNGVIGEQEQHIIIPAIKEAQDKRILAFGPYPADGFYGSGSYAKFDGVLAMYHDQGLVPFKMLASEDGVNYTAGSKYIRTSPAHGVAYDIAGKDMASPSSMRAAIYMAIDIFRSRIDYDKFSSNPLQRQMVNHGADESIDLTQADEPLH